MKSRMLTELKVQEYDIFSCRIQSISVSGYTAMPLKSRSLIIKDQLNDEMESDEIGVGVLLQLNSLHELRTSELMYTLGGIKAGVAMQQRKVCLVST